MPDAFDWRAELRIRLALDANHVDASTEADIIDELAQHLEDQTRDLAARGMSLDAARAQLLSELDDSASALSALVQHRCSGSRLAPPIGDPSTVRGLLASIRHDLAYGARSLARAPAMTSVIILSLGIVIGANTAIFGLMHDVLLRRLSLPHPEQLVALRPMNGGYRATIHYADYKTLVKESGIQRIEAYVPEGATLSVGGDHTDAWIELTTGGYFDVLGVPPMFGRTFSRADETSAAPVVVVSEDYWREHLGGDRNAIGRSITINDAPFTIIGVMPHTFAGIFFAHRFTAAIPLPSASTFDADLVSRYGVALIARLPDGIHSTAAVARFSGAFLRCCAMTSPGVGSSAKATAKPRVMPPDAPTSASGGWTDTLNATPHVNALDASRGLTWSVDFRQQYQQILIALMAGVALLLLIACANVGVLLLSRAAARQREFAVRMSLGASRRRMVRQLLTESFELAVAGSLLGVLFSWAGTTLLLHGLPSNAQQLGDVIAWRTSPAIMGFTILATFACTIFFGIWPARRASRTDILVALTGADRAQARSRGATVETILAVAQIPLALVLVTTATLFVMSLRHLERGDGGYHRRNVLLARIDRDSIGAVAQGIADELTRMPDVDAVGVSASAPVINDFWMFFMLDVPGHAPAPGERPPAANIVSPGFFEATGIGLRAGREFTPVDGVNGEPVAIVSESFARRYFGDRNPIGQSLFAQIGTRIPLRIIGVANDAAYTDLHASPDVMWYLPLAQYNAHEIRTLMRSVVLSVRTTGDPIAIAPTVRRTIAANARDARIRKIATVGQLMDDALAKERFAAALATLFGVVALGLAVLGVYGVAAYGVSRRTSEIGIRMALGATSGDALRIVLWQTVVMSGIGVGIGIPLAYAASRAIGSQLSGITANDPWVMIATALALMLAGVSGGAIPGRRAANVDPMIALRSD